MVKCSETRKSALSFQSPSLELAPHGKMLEVRSDVNGCGIILITASDVVTCAVTGPLAEQSGPSYTAGCEGLVCRWESAGAQGTPLP